MSDWLPPAPLRQPVPRRTKPTGASVGIAIVSFLLLLLVPLGMAVKALIEIRSVEGFKDSGIEAKGIITGLHTDMRYNVSRNGHKTSHVVYYVNYVYRIVSPDLGHAETDYRRTADVGRSDYSNLAINEVVDIIYDPDHPEQSRLDFEQAPAARGDPPDAPGRHLYITYGIIALAIAVVPTLLVREHLRIKLLLTWGDVAQATIVEMENGSDQVGS